MIWSFFTKSLRLLQELPGYCFCWNVLGILSEISKYYYPNNDKNFWFKDEYKGFVHDIWWKCYNAEFIVYNIFIW